MLFPLLRALSELKGGGDELLQARVLAIKLMCRIFLIHLPEFLSLADTFHVRVLRRPAV